MTDRPTTRGECGEIRPCPWVSCRQHLLLEIAVPRGRRPTALRVNGPREPTAGRRPGLLPNASPEEADAWTDRAVDMLERMEFTCALDVVDRYPDGAPPSVIGRIFGVAEQLIDLEVRAAAGVLESSAGVLDG